MSAPERNILVCIWLFSDCIDNG